MDITDVIQIQKNFFKSGKTLNLEKRKRLLRNLLGEIKARENEIFLALKKDLGKSPQEAFLTEVSIVKEEIKLALRKLDKWANKKNVATSLMTFPSKCQIYTQPFGTVLIISPWNYPFLLSLSPLVSAIAAGNTVIIKTSKKSEATSRVIEKIICGVFIPSQAFFVRPSVCDYNELLDAKYDFVFFTGSEKIGKKVMSACSKNLTPVCLELGGKSPCIVDKTANLKIAAKRIAWGKLLNSGQTCVAPDYILVQKDIKNRFLNELAFQIKNMYPNPLLNKSYPKIIDENHFHEIIKLIEREKSNIILGGNYDKNSLKIEPTILNNINTNSPSMKSELFAPIFPIIEFENQGDIFKIISSHETPLALYVFTENKYLAEKIISKVSFGGGCVNDTILHLANNRLPFGGVGTSGMGNYHGKFGFDTFSRKKGIVKNSLLFDIPLRYPPFHKESLTLFKKFL
ncbi:MAG: aldehyde dehydrogenase family protein [Oscillospiraceae bacterium]